MKLFVNSDEVRAMVEEKDRKPELGYHLSMQLTVKNNDENVS